MIIGACLGAMLSACERPAPPQSQDATKPAKTRRLAVLSPALAQTLRDLGAGDLIVARHGWDSFTPQSTPPVGNEGGIDYESLLKVAPTHVVMEAGAKEAPARLTELAGANAWQIVRVPNLTLGDIARGTGTLAEAAGIDPDAAAGARSRFEASFAAAPGLREKAGRVLILIGTDPPALVGPGSFHFEMVERLGADAIPDNGAPFIQWSVENVLKADPDTIVLLAPSASSSDANENLGPLKKLDLRCVRRGAVVVITNPKCHLPATSLGEIATELRTRLEALPATESAETPAGKDGP